MAVTTPHDIKPIHLVTHQNDSIGQPKSPTDPHQLFSRRGLTQRVRLQVKDG